MQSSEAVQNNSRIPEALLLQTAKKSEPAQTRDAGDQYVPEAADGIATAHDTSSSTRQSSVSTTTSVLPLYGNVSWKRERCLWRSNWTRRIPQYVSPLSERDGVPIQSSQREFVIFTHSTIL